MTLKIYNRIMYSANLLENIFFALLDLSRGAELAPVILTFELGILGGTFFIELTKACLEINTLMEKENGNVDCEI